MVNFYNVKLGEVCDILNGDRGFNYPSPKDFVEFGIPFFNAGCISGTSIKFDNVDYISEDHYNRLGGAKIKKGDILFCLRGSLGKYALIEFDEGAPASSLAVLRAYASRLNSHFLLHTLGSDIITNQISMQNSGSSQPNLSAESVKEFVIPLPDIFEQNVIAETLSDVDNLIASLQKLINKKKYIKQGAMQELLTGKKRLPQFEESWVKVRLGDHCNIFDGTHQTPHYVESGISFYSVENITSNDFIHTKYILEDEHMQLTTKYKIEKGDILMTRIGSIGVCKYIDWNVNASFYVSLALIKCIGKIDAQFLCYYANSDEFKKEIEIHSLLMAIPQKINLGPISEIIVTIPKSMDEQKAIAQILSDMDEEIEQLEKKLVKYQLIKQGMMQELLTGHIRLVKSKEQSQNKAHIIKEQTSQNHNQHFDDAVMLAGIVNAFYSDKYPLGRKKLQKLLYLLRRKEQVDISSFHKKAAGPYADIVRYKGGEPIAKKNKYIVESKSKMGSCFSKGENIQQALTYLDEWNKQRDIEWLISEFQYAKVDELELLATVDMAMCDLSQEGRPVTVQSIKDLIQSTKEWRDKLKKTFFSDSDIQRAIIKCREMFQEVF